MNGVSAPSKSSSAAFIWVPLRRSAGAGSELACLLQCSATLPSSFMEFCFRIQPRLVSKKIYISDIQCKSDRLHIDRLQIC